MKKDSRSWRWLWALLIASVATAGACAEATAADVEASLAQRLEALEAEVDAIRETDLRPHACSGRPSSDPCCVTRDAGFYAGFAFVFMKPHAKEAFQATVVDGSGVFRMVPFSHEYDATPRVWFGYSGEGGLGVRARYWQFDQAIEPFHSNPMTAAQAHAVTVIFPATISATPPNVLNVADELEAQTVDLEGTQAISMTDLSLLIGGGLRYALMRQQTDATVTNAGVVEQSLNWHRRFEGVGPSLSAEMERPLGSSGLAIIGAFRGSLLFGNKDLDRVETNGIGGGPPVVSLDKAKEVLGIGEIELGLQWTRQLAQGGDLFLRGAYEGQLWSDSGTPTLGYLGFQGFSVGFGLTR